MKFAQKPIVRIAIFCIATVIGVIIALAAPPEGYTVELMRFLGIFVWMIICMVFTVAPDWLVLLVALVACVLLKVNTFSTIFGQFAGSTVWNIIVLSAFVNSMASTGLFKRIALKILTFFKPTYNGQVLAIMTSSTALTPLVPGEISKLGIMSPMSCSVSRASGYADHSKPAAGLFTASFVPIYIGSLAFMSGTPTVYMLLGYIGDHAAKFTWVFWAGACILWFVIILVLFYFFITRYYKPAEDSEVASSEVTAKEQYEALGPISKGEKLSLVVLAVCLALWTTEAIHGISGLYVSIGAFAVVTIAGLFTNRDFGTRIPWLVVFLAGFILGILTLCSTTGFTNWVGGIITPILGPLASNIYIMVPIICISAYILRSFVVSQNTTTIIIYSAFAPIVLTAGGNPWFVVFCAYASTCVWNVKFTSVAYIQAEAFAGGFIEHKDVIPSSIAFMVINLIAMLASIPIWQLMGLA